MNEVLLARKSWSNAAAFVAMNPETGNVFVYGKFYMEDGGRCRGYGGPVTETLDTIPAHLFDEAKKLSWNISRSQELGAFCEKVFAKAKEVEPWFGY